MIRKTLSHLALPVIATAALLVAAGPALAQHGGHGGGFHAGGGGFHTGGGLHGGVYRGGFGGSRYGYRPSYGGYGAYPYYRGGYYPRYYGGWYYPYYGSGYYPYSYGIGYSAPDTSAAVSDPSTPSAQAPGTGSENIFTPDGSAVPAGSATHMTVRLPADADLWFDGTQMTGTGPVREFNTPPLTAGQKYTYDIRARWVDNDTVRDQKQTIVFAPGDNVEVHFPTPSGTGEKAKSAAAP